MEITYDQVSEIIADDFRKYLIEKYYRITAKPITVVNPTYNAILERIHQVRGNRVQNFNIKETYAGKDYPQFFILESEALVILSAADRLKGYSLAQLVFGCGMIILIKHNVN